MADKFDEMKDKSADAMSGNEDKVQDGMQSAADKGDEMTGGKYADHIEKGRDAASEKMDEWGDSTQQ